MSDTKSKVIMFFKAFALILFIAVPIWFKYAVFEKTVLEGSDNMISFVIPKNSSMAQISDTLRNSGFDITYRELKLTSKWYGLDGRIRHGEFIYTKNGKTSVRELIEFLTKNGTLTSNITVPEGSRISEIAGILRSKMNIDSVSFVEKTKDPVILKTYGIEGSSLEGYLYPETYNFNASDTIEVIIDRMVKTQRSKMSEVKDLLDSSSFSEREIITLASIIQGEVMYYSEAEDISAVYNNRLKKNMLLQADPTIQYILGKPKRLLFKDISIDDPYNTYLYKGLPPGPINNPSIRSVKAALQPSKEKYLYMVAKGDGTHYFNHTLEEHLKDKKKLDDLRKELRRKK
ncbi:MAG TPA: endolytic transglycosylase MltG [Clostridiales bacterium]|nr:endolytic transglycosylase MltG [Clostridiales bacterium]